MEKSEFKNRRFLITGATQGIGLAATKHLVAEGHEVIGIAKKSPELGFPGKLFICDLTDSETTRIVFEEIKRNDPIDGVVNNVGIALPQPLEKSHCTILRLF